MATPRTLSSLPATLAVSFLLSPSSAPSKPCTTLSLVTPPRWPVPSRVSPSPKPPSPLASLNPSSPCTQCATPKCLRRRFSNTAPTPGSLTPAGSVPVPPQAASVALSSTLVLSSTPFTLVSSPTSNTKPTKPSVSPSPRPAPTSLTSCSTPPSHGTVPPTSRVKSRSSASSLWRTSRSTKTRPPRKLSRVVHTYAAAPSTRWLISVPTYLSYFFDRLTSGFPLLSRGRAITPIDVSGYSFPPWLWA